MLYLLYGHHIDETGETLLSTVTLTPLNSSGTRKDKAKKLETVGTTTTNLINNGTSLQKNFLWTPQHIYRYQCW